MKHFPNSGEKFKFDGMNKWNGSMVIYTFQNENNEEMWACQQPADGLPWEGYGKTPKKAYKDWLKKTITEEKNRG